MKSLDRAVRRDRAKRYKYLKKLFKARDAASKHVKQPVKVSHVLKYFGRDFLEWSSAAAIAKVIVKKKGRIQPLRPPRPPAMKSASLPKYPPDPPEGPKPRKP